MAIDCLCLPLHPTHHPHQLLQPDLLIERLILLFNLRSSLPPRLINQLLQPQLPTAQSGKPSVGFSLIAFLLLFLGTFLYFYHPKETNPPPLAAASSPPAIEYEVTTSDVTVDWAGGGDFDPRDKCPPDFFREGFVVLYKRVADGGYFRFLYHKGRKLLYRIDKEVVDGKAHIGLHWVESTKFSSKYRIADPAFKGGRTVKVPNAKGGMVTQTFRYGQSVSKRKVQRDRELFRETHIDPDQCPEWWDILNFFP